AQVASHVTEKLIRRHPHVFGETEVRDAGEVLRNWDQIKASEPGREQGVFGEVPENLPALLYARKLQRRAASAGLHPRADTERGDQECFNDIGQRLFALVDEARRAQVDPELALRAAAQCFREQIETEQM
ncbi:MAG: nucleoside triphosphate pyrophosphohydrolase, partial [Solirubrobacteraceae bacterium]